MSKSLQCLFGLFESAKNPQHDSDKEKEKMQKKTTFENDSDDTIPEGVSKLKSFSMTILTVAVGNLLFTLSHLPLD